MENHFFFKSSTSIFFRKKSFLKRIKIWFKSLKLIFGLLPFRFSLADCSLLALSVIFQLLIPSTLSPSKPSFFTNSLANSSLISTLKPAFLLLRHHRPYQIGITTHRPSTIKVPLVKEIEFYSNPSYSIILYYHLSSFVLPYLLINTFVNHNSLGDSI